MIDSTLWTAIAPPLPVSAVMDRHGLNGSVLNDYMYGVCFWWSRQYRPSKVIALFRELFWGRLFI